MFMGAPAKTTAWLARLWIGTAPVRISAIVAGFARLRHCPDLLLVPTAHFEVRDGAAMFLPGAVAVPAGMAVPAGYTRLADGTVVIDEVSAAAVRQMIRDEAKGSASTTARRHGRQR